MVIFVHVFFKTFESADCSNKRKLEMAVDSYTNTWHCDEFSNLVHMALWWLLEPGSSWQEFCFAFHYRSAVHWNDMYALVMSGIITRWPQNAFSDPTLGSNQGLSISAFMYMNLTNAIIEDKTTKTIASATYAQDLYFNDLRKRT